MEATRRHLGLRNFKPVEPWTHKQVINNTKSKRRQELKWCEMRLPFTVRPSYILHWTSKMAFRQNPAIINKPHNSLGFSYIYGSHRRHFAIPCCLESPPRCPVTLPGCLDTLLLSCFVTFPRVSLPHCLAASLFCNLAVLLPCLAVSLPRCRVPRCLVTSLSCNLAALCR